MLGCVGVLTWSSPGSYSPFSPAGLQGSIGCWHTSRFTGCERACGIPDLLPEPLQKYPCVDVLLLGLLHMDTVQNQFLYCQWRRGNSVVLVILLIAPVFIPFEVSLASFPGPHPASRHLLYGKWQEAGQWHVNEAKVSWQCCTRYFIEVSTEQLCRPPEHPPVGARRSERCQEDLRRYSQRDICFKLAYHGLFSLQCQCMLSVAVAMIHKLQCSCWRTTLKSSCRLVALVEMLRALLSRTLWGACHCGQTKLIHSFQNTDYCTIDNTPSWSEWGWLESIVGAPSQIYCVVQEQKATVRCTCSWSC